MSNDGSGGIAVGVDDEVAEILGSDVESNDGDRKASNAKNEVEELLASDDDGEGQEEEEELSTISIVVRTQGGTTYSLKDISPQMTVGKLKELTANEAGSMAASEMKLLLKGAVLTDDSATVESLNLVEGSVLFMVKKLEPMKKLPDPVMPKVVTPPPVIPPEPVRPTSINTLSVKTQGGQIYTLNDTSFNATVYDLKLKICQQDDKLNPEGIKLIFQGKALTNDEQTVESIGVSEGGIMFMVLRLDNKRLEETVKTGNDVKIDAQSTGMMRFRVPPGGVGRQVRVQPPTGPAFMVQVPGTVRVGDLMQVPIPRQQPAENNPPAGQAPGAGSLMKVQCPYNKRPGEFMQIQVPGRGLMRVKIPTNAIPGQQFFFRIPAA